MGYVKSDVAPTCHPHRRMGERGMCHPCYERMRTNGEFSDIGKSRMAPPPKCHPDKPAMARGLCATCYERIRVRGERYKITVAQFDVMWEKQLGLCAICLSALIRDGRKPRSAAVDHDHKTGEVRGILCRRCNAGLGYFLDDPESIDRAASYLRHKP